MCWGFTLFVLALLVLVIGHLISMGAPGLSLDLLTKVPTGDPDHPGGMLPALAGTGVLIGLASLVGVPIGILAGVYLSEYGVRSRLATSVRFLADVLASVPSIVVGILGYELVVVPMGRFNGWAGALALAFIMIPIVTRTTEEMLRLVPNGYREASIALGATKARTILSILFPAAAGTLVTGIMLAIARIAGETAPLLFTALGSRLLTLDPNQPFPSLTVQIFNYATGPYAEQRKLAGAGILLLVSLVLVLNLVIRRLARQKVAER
jgi:phosphate transport system permease protein